MRRTSSASANGTIFSSSAKMKGVPALLLLLLHLVAKVVSTAGPHGAWPPPPEELELVREVKLTIRDISQQIWTHMDDMQALAEGLNLAPDLHEDLMELCKMAQKSQQHHDFAVVAAFDSQHPPLNPLHKTSSLATDGSSIHLPTLTRHQKAASNGELLVGFLVIMPRHSDQLITE